MTSDPHNLQRFVDSQDGIIATALDELRAGRKQSHWMWFVFPQLAGLGHSSTAQKFAIASIDEARSYVAHPVLGPRLRQSVEALLPWAGTRTADQILGPVDALKLRSSLTLFDIAIPDDLFGQALNLFYPGPDPRTLALLKEAR